MAKKANNDVAPIDIDSILDFGVELSATQSFTLRGHGGGGGRGVDPMPDVTTLSVAEWSRQWVGNRSGEATACKQALVDGAAWPTVQSKYCDRGSFLGRFAKPGSGVARGIGDGPVVIEKADGNCMVVGYWTYRAVGGADVVVSETYTGKDGNEATRDVRCLEAETYTVSVRLKLASGELYAVATVKAGEFVTPRSLDKASIVKVG